MAQSDGAETRGSMDSWPRCERAMGFIAMLVGTVFLALAGLVIYKTDSSISKGLIALATTGCVGVAVGLFMFLNAGKTTN